MRLIYQSISMKLDFETGVTVPMRGFWDEKKTNEYNIIYTDIPESTAISEMNNRTNRILDAKYEKTNIDQYVQECIEYRPQFLATKTTKNLTTKA